MNSKKKFLTQCLQRVGRGIILSLLLLAIASKLLSPLNAWSYAWIALDSALALICFFAWRKSLFWVLGLYGVFASMAGYHLWIAPGQTCNCFGALAWLNQLALLICTMFCVIVVVSWHLPFSKLESSAQWFDAAICLGAILCLLLVELGDQTPLTCQHQAKSIVVEQLATQDSLAGQVICFGDLDCIDCREKLRQVSWLFATSDRNVVFFCQQKPNADIVREFATRAMFLECEGKLPADCRSPLVFLIGEDREGVECIEFVQ